MCLCVCLPYWDVIPALFCDCAEHDHAELMLLATDAQHAKEVALGELDRVRSQARQEQDKRSKALKEKQLLAKARSERDALARERDRLKAEAMEELTGNAGEELRTSLEEAEMEASRVKEEAGVVMKKLDVYDEAFKKIKEATGVSDVNEVIQKVMAQEQQQASLKALTKDNQDRIEGLNAEISALKERVEDLRYSGSGFAAVGCCPRCRRPELCFSWMD
jgi:coiled-coil domain-containing protein 151